MKRLFKIRDNPLHPRNPRAIHIIMTTRRNFIKTTTLTAIGTAFLPHMLNANPRKKNIGLQLYTLRDQMNVNIPKTLNRVAEIGYTWLEAAGYGNGKFYGLAPKEFKTLVDDLGMQVISSHCGFKVEESSQVIDAHAELGVTYLVYPWMSMPETPSSDDYKKTTELFNELANLSGNAGLKFGYHNHDFEFKKIGDTTGFDILLNQTDPEKVCFEADFYWMVYAGVDPLEYIHKYPGRFELWHIKDMEDSPDRLFAPVGTGVIDFKRIFNDKKVSGMKYFFVEQDKCKDEPLKSVEISYKNLVSLVY